MSALNINREKRDLSEKAYKKEKARVFQYEYVLDSNFGGISTQIIF